MAPPPFRARSGRGHRIHAAPPSLTLPEPHAAAIAGGPTAAPSGAATGSSSPARSPVLVHNWPEPDRVGRQELEIVMGNEHISFTTSKIGSLVDVQTSKDPEGLRIFYYLVQPKFLEQDSCLTFYYTCNRAGQAAAPRSIRHGRRDDDDLSSACLCSADDAAVSSSLHLSPAATRSSGFVNALVGDAA